MKLHERLIALRDRVEEIYEHLKHSNLASPQEEARIVETEEDAAKLLHDAEAAVAGANLNPATTPPAG